MDHKVTEHFITLSLNPDSGRYLVLGNYLTYGIIGAVLMDLSLEGKITIDNQIIKAERDSKPTGISAYDRMLRTISDSSRERSVKVWVRRLGQKSPWYRKEMQKYLAEKGILKVEKKRFIGIPYRLHYPARPGARKSLVNRYKDVILYNKPGEDHETMMLGLMLACRMHRVITKGGPERRKLRKKLVEIIRNNVSETEISNTIIEIREAITSAVATTAAIASSTAATGSGAGGYMVGFHLLRIFKWI